LPERRHSRSSDGALVSRHLNEWHCPSHRKLDDRRVPYLRPVDHVCGVSSIERSAERFVDSSSAFIRGPSLGHPMNLEHVSALRNRVHALPSSIERDTTLGSFGARRISTAVTIRRHSIVLEKKPVDACAWCD
jgi:hypothetical protein